LDGTVVVRFSGTGRWQWGLSITEYVAGSTFTPVDIALAPDGRVAVLGRLHGAMDFGGIIAGGCGGSDDGAGPTLVMYGADGVAQWVHVASDGTGCSGGHEPAPRRVSFDSAGALVYAGQHRFSMSMGGCSVGGSPYYQPHVFEFAADGTCTFAQQWPVQGGIEHASLHDVAVTDGSLVLTGSLPGFDTWLDFGGGALTGSGQYLVHLDRLGGHRFSAILPMPMRVAAASDGRVFMAARFTGTIDLGDGPLTSVDAGDALVAEYSATGTLLDDHILHGAAGDQDVYRIDADSSNTPRIIGQADDDPASYFLAPYKP
ncbi:MAG: hypothetical protein AAGC55_08075, partial [Myxococcota bacterium]